MITIDNYYIRLVAAFVRGRCQQNTEIDIEPELFNADLESLDEASLVRIADLGLSAGLRLHKFKRTQLPRVRRVLGVLRSVGVASLLDVGSGRGVFLWPLLDEFQYLPVTAIDLLEHRVNDIEAVRLGGIETLSCRQADISKLDCPDNEFDVVTMLEVLEHIPEPLEAWREAVRVARRFLIISVPSKEDDNPDHLHLIDEQKLRSMFAGLGVHRVNIDYVLNHMVAVASL